MLRAAVTAVRHVSFKPMRPLSGVHAGVILFFLETQSSQGLQTKRSLGPLESLK